MLYDLQHLVACNDKTKSKVHRTSTKGLNDQNNHDGVVTEIDNQV